MKVSPHLRKHGALLLLTIASATGCQGKRDPGDVGSHTIASQQPTTSPKSEDDKTASDVAVSSTSEGNHEIPVQLAGHTAEMPTPDSMATSVETADTSQPKAPDAANDQNESPGKSSLLPVAPKVALSAPASRLKKLIDEGKWNAASTLLEAYLQQYPDDGGVHAMHGRILLNNEDTLTDYIPADSQTDAVLQAFKNAVEFDSSTKPLVADILLRHAHTLLTDAAANGTPATFIDLYMLAQQEFDAGTEQMEQTEEAGNIAKLAESVQLMGLVTVGNFIAAERGNLYYAGGWDHGIMLANEYDPQRCQAWASHLANLGPKFAEQGLFGSAMYMRSASTWLAGVKDKQTRALESLSVLADQSEKIAADEGLRRRADVAISHFMKAGWEAETKSLVQEKNPVVMQVIKAVVK